MAVICGGSGLAGPAETRDRIQIISGLKNTFPMIGLSMLSQLRHSVPTEFATSLRQQKAVDYG
jgi:hypothetical protein